MRCSVSKLSGTRYTNTVYAFQKYGVHPICLLVCLGYTKQTGNDQEAWHSVFTDDQIWEQEQSLLFGIQCL